jgi:hypothetical protein
MAVKISRRIAFGAGSKGFRFHNYANAAGDRKHYEEGRSLEEARFRKGTLAQKMYARLSVALSSTSKVRPVKERKA